MLLGEGDACDAYKAAAEKKYMFDHFRVSMFFIAVSLKS